LRKKGFFVATRLPGNLAVLGANLALINVDRFRRRSFRVSFVHTGKSIRVFGNLDFERDTRG
jgi:hypothetical protein